MSASILVGFVRVGIRQQNETMTDNKDHIMTVSDNDCDEFKKLLDAGRPHNCIATFIDV